VGNKGFKITALVSAGVHRQEAEMESRFGPRNRELGSRGFARIDLSIRLRPPVPIDRQGMAMLIKAPAGTIPEAAPARIAS
jgi:hypothetical protein